MGARHVPFGRQGRLDVSPQHGDMAGAIGFGNGTNHPPNDRQEALQMTARYQTSRPDQWTCPRPTPDPMGNKYGAIMPMEQPRSIWWWPFGKGTR